MLYIKSEPHRHLRSLTHSQGSTYCNCICPDSAVSHYVVPEPIFCLFSTDVNECEMLSSVCGEAQCVNTDGSFTCVCPSGMNYIGMFAKCEPVPTGDPPDPPFSFCTVFKKKSQKTTECITGFLSLI